ncbi:MAG: hypothetical protein EOP45_05875 [Sphingobacteriaceae bacterium]|nr:MAG: hypothetical protein EOP45_05875 [Sphingobacteriaceae bacterium]
MNTDCLNKYDVSFYKTAKGQKVVDCKNRISAYLYIWKDLDDIDDFLDAMNQCLSGKFNLIKDPNFGDSLLNLYGLLTPDSLIISERDGLYPITIPLIDFKEILLSWKEFQSNK